MRKLNYVAILVATVAAFIAAAVYYIVFGEAYAEVSAAAREAAKTGPQLWEIPVELGRSLIVAVVVAWLAAATKAHTWVRAALLGLALWVGFPFVLWTGAMAHENTSLQLAAIHGGDWLLKLLVISLIVGLWPSRQSRQTQAATD